jgi:hypothetical protein
MAKIGKIMLLVKAVLPPLWPNGFALTFGGFNFRMPPDIIES